MNQYRKVIVFRCLFDQLGVTKNMPIWYATYGASRWSFGQESLVVLEAIHVGVTDDELEARVGLPGRPTCGSEHAQSSRRQCADSWVVQLDLTVGYNDCTEKARVRSRSWEEQNSGEKAVWICNGSHFELKIGEFDLPVSAIDTFTKVAIMHNRVTKRFFGYLL